MTEILQEREPSRRGPVVAGVLAAVVLALAVARVLAGDVSRLEAPSPPAATPAGPVRPFVTTGDFGTAVDHGEYAYAARLRSVWSTRVTVLSVTALGSDGGVIETVVAAPAGGTDYTAPLAWRTQPEVESALVRPGDEFLAVVRVRPDCGSRRRLAGLRIVVRLPDGTQAAQDIRPLDAPTAGLASLREAACTAPDVPAGPVGDGEVFEVTGANGRALVDEGLVAYEFGVASRWPAPVTVLRVTPLDVTGTEVPVELATLVPTANQGAEKYDLGLRAEPAVVPPDSEWWLLVRMVERCSPRRVVTAVRLTISVGAETVEQVLPLARPDRRPSCAP